MADSPIRVTASVTAENTGTDVLQLRGAPALDLSISGSWSATVHLQRRRPGEAAAAWRDVKAYTANAEELVEHVGDWEYRLFCKTGNFTSGTIVLELAR